MVRTGIISSYKKSPPLREGRGAPSATKLQVRPPVAALRSRTNSATSGQARDAVTDLGEMRSELCLIMKEFFCSSGTKDSRERGARHARILVGSRPQEGCGEDRTLQSFWRARTIMMSHHYAEKLNVRMRLGAQAAAPVLLEGCLEEAPDGRKDEFLSFHEHLRGRRSNSWL